MLFSKKLMLFVIALITSSSAYAALNSQDSVSTAIESKVPYFAQWPTLQSAIGKDPLIEKRITEILVQMTLQEKVGQMIQPELREVTPQEAKSYKLGSLLNGGGGWPNNNKYATAKDWAQASDKYWLALQEAYQGRGFKIPFMWATDAVHGHNNVFKATVFPHNIGLGAANNPDLIYKIGQATALEIAATGLDWTFAPTVATPRDYRWGRVYEGYSEDPEIVYQYAKSMVEGIQGGAAGLAGDSHVISNVKHWVGDGGTQNGVDRGENHYSEDYLRNIHATGYFAGLEAGAQVVMTSFNSWHNDANYAQVKDGQYNKKLHGSKYLITDVLKNKMGFDGIVVTDWNGQSEISGCSAANCPAAVNAGNDVFMVTARNDWQAFYHNVIAQVNDGTIPLSRIDDAVTRILRVKMRANLWAKVKPSQRPLAGHQELLGSAEHRALARQAVSESLVLLKNADNILPLAVDQKILIAGSAANDIQKQTGGWSLTWQGNENNVKDDFPGATTMLMALQGVVGRDNIISKMSDANEKTVAVVVIGEDPYAEMFGDIKANKTLEFSTIKPAYLADLEKIKALKAAGLKVVTIFYSGRPLYVNEEINNSDAFVAAWLPGTEAGGITDVLFNKKGKHFSGRLSYSWPMKKCSTTINRIAPNIVGYKTPPTEQDISGEHKPLFAYGYGLFYGSPVTSEHDLNNLALDPRDFGCGQNAPDRGLATTKMEVFGRDASAEFVARIGGEANGWASVDVSNGSETSIAGLTTRPINYKHQQDALNVSFDGKNAAQFYMQTGDSLSLDKNSYANADSTLQFDIRMHKAPTADTKIAMHCQWPCLGEVKINRFLPAVSDYWATIKIPLSCFAKQGMDYSILNTALLISTAGEMEFDLGEIRFVPRSLDTAAAELSCANLADPALPALDEAFSDIYSAPWNSSVSVWSANITDWSPAADLIRTETVVNDKETVVNVTYNSAALETQKGVVILSGETQNLSHYRERGTLQFDLMVSDYAANVDGLVVKMEGPNNSGPDYFLPIIPVAEWTAISVPVNKLVTDEIVKTITKPFVILPAWANPQAGVAFSFKNVRLVK
ncbi:glycoside hydrolase family 3 protein [Psychromonas antarctica]|uniref:glycoside hydrolase family 3 protein n=1 Tax=Psychromonas antarctica TaxID=67573 RepID=UPI001EE9AACE|nr:glycoside hydrolase family 3 protein [Psychromonas antarctica]MCG6201097.1 exo 1,3/1,4-beta-D-glucan glucohydrolase [Psychromonas antarctica]